MRIRRSTGLSSAAALLMLAGTATATATGPSVIWGVKSASGPGVASTPPSRLFHLDPSDPTGLTEIANVTVDGAGVDVDGLVIDADGALHGFVLSADGAQLVSIDPITAAATPIGDLLKGRDVRGAVQRANGVIVAVDAAADELIDVDPATGAVVGAPRPVTVNCPRDVSTGCDLAIRDDGVPVLLDGNAVLTIDLETGAAAPLLLDDELQPGGFLVFLAGGTFADGSVLVAYDVNGSDDLYTYDTAGDGARSDLLLDVVPSFNAGRGDLAAAVSTPAVTPDPFVAGDLNGDGIVDGADLGLLLSAWGGRGAADLNCDGIIDGADLGLLLAGWS